ncbi:pilus assembly PilX N-terminal domain-containing protein [Desulfotomaculum copahuensis]|uniref:Type 4 fimbrial biogenesis protein PilX N-terminal domain-containing protein n=1 Tax=Desulfotomaculum copahuensis TaxID=1838280 RepID=A0A1B7LBD9_9FIRM|nr:pilus assembly PilX N-terminal domain-containing protein [Desulfotomaculum copahuensis]OAT79857.1 hypothetical protein A6M21_14755 [Desulfotomaculum copahuensis]
MLDACACSRWNDRAFPRHSRGFAAVMVIMVTAVLFLLGSAVLALAAQHRQMAIRHYQQTQAYYIAEAGVQTVLADREWLNRLEGIVPDYNGDREKEYNNSKYYPADGDHTHSFGGGTFIVKAVLKQDFVMRNEKNEQVRYKVFRIYSTGTCAGNTRVLVVTVRVPTNGGPVERITWQEKYPLF